MKKLLTILFIFCAFFTQAQYVSTLRVAGEDTQFGTSLAQGMQVFNTYNNELYVVTCPIESTATITSADSCLKLIVDYDRLTDNYLSMFQGVRWNKNDNTINVQGV